MKLKLIKSTRSKKWAMLILEILIVITILWILAAIAMNTLWSQAWWKARDAVRESKLNEISSILTSLQNRYHVPILSWKWVQYPTDCITGSDFYKCFSILKVAPSEDKLKEMLSDPLQWTKTEWSLDYKFWYVADEDWYKLCAVLEEQWATDKLNADSSWKKVAVSWLNTSASAENMHCIFWWDTSWIDATAVNPINLP